MPAHKIVTREIILKAAFDILRHNGIDSVNARSIAKRIGCSTQPIYHAFRGMDELKTELRSVAADRHMTKVRKYIESSRYPPYMAYGMGLVTFASQEKKLFQYLYMQEHNDSPALAQRNAAERLRIICEVYGYSSEAAMALDADIHIFCIGLALEANTGVLKLTDEELSTRLHREFLALTSLYGKPCVPWPGGNADS